MDEQVKKVKVNFGNDVGGFVRQFNGQIATVTGEKGKSEKTTLCLLSQGGLYLRDDQMTPA